MSRSAVTWACAFGFWIFTTTDSPVIRVAVCTCATDATARGSGLISAKISDSGRDCDAPRTASSSGHGTGVDEACRWDSSAAKIGPTRSGRLDSIWPILMKVTPPSLSALRRARAVAVVFSVWIDVDPKSSNC